MVNPLCPSLRHPTVQGENAFCFLIKSVLQNQAHLSKGISKKACFHSFEAQYGGWTLTRVLIEARGSANIQRVIVFGECESTKTQKG